MARFASSTPARFKSSTGLLTRWLATPQVWIWAVLFVISLAIQLYFSTIVRPAEVSATWHQHLGGEYFNIAQAIVDGRGFSDPFGEATGPTAWMPPLYPALLACILWAVRSRALVAAVILALTHASVATIGTTVYSIARRRSRFAPPSLVVAIVVAWLVAFNVWFSMITQDVWLIALGVNAMVVLICRRVERGEAKPWAWAVVGGVFLFSSPALVVPWAILVAYFAVQDRQWRRWATAGAMFVALAVPWTARNALTFHAFIPVKANLAYDAYASNVIDDDGIYDNKHLMLHPFTNSVTRFEYARLGEVGFNEHYRELMADHLRKHRKDVMRRVVNRVVAATVDYRPIAQDEGGRILSFTRVIYCLPLISFLILALLSERDRKLTDACCLFSAAYLAPYVLVAFYVRYWLALTPIFLLVIFLATDAVLVRLRESALFRRRGSATTPVEEATSS
jgi:hypothetical protein